MKGVNAPKTMGAIPSPGSGSRRSSAQRLSRAAGLFVCGLGVMILLGWLLRIEFLRSFDSPINVKANTALAFIASGASLALLDRGRATARVVGVFLGALSSAIGFVTLTEHVSGWNLGIDELLFRDIPGVLATASPGRMGPPASICFSLAGIALVLLHANRADRTVQALAIVIMLWALLAITGYTYGAEQLYGVARLTGIALQTAVALLALGGGLLAARTMLGFAAVFTSDLAGGSMARRLLPIAVAVPFALGALYILVRRREVMDRGFGVAVLMLTIIAVFTGLIWGSALRIDSAERRLQASEARTAALYAQAQEAVEVRDAFLSIAGHEFRTPLNALRLQLHNLRRKGTATAEDEIARLERQVDRLVRLTDQLLDVSRLHSEGLQLETGDVDLSLLAQQVVERLGDIAERSGSRVSVVAAPGVVGRWDAFRLDQVLTNLVSNALKFGGGRPVEVAVSVSPESARLTVRDEGIGISPEHQGRIFERFERAVPDHSFGGMGLGLWISREIVGAHGGTIRVQSEPGKGSLFEVSLPRTTA